MDPDNKRLCQCGHDLDLHGARGCTAGNSQGRQCWCSRSQNGVLALFAPPKPRPISLQPVRETDVDAILSKFWTVQKHNQAEHEEQVRILGERRTQSGRKIP
jgi:hypothetical protein